MTYPIKLNIIARSMIIDDFSELSVAEADDPGGERPLDVIRKLHRLGKNTFVIRSKPTGGVHEDQLCIISYVGPDWQVVSNDYGNYESLTLEQAADIFDRGYGMRMFG